MSGWLGGLQVRGTERGQVPVADWLCTRCLAHRRATGKQRVRDLVASNPTETHRDQCPANRKDA
ncbi:transcription factor WhiB [Streptomyces sp. NPDC052015]|uniref:transcription factor WhiB n=1 Tax=Streptomyces sp. NPDC052015 TaxID=3154755 RepID=UPI003424C2B1